MPDHQRTCALINVLDHQDPFQPFHNDTFGYYCILQHKLSIQNHLILLLHIIMNVANYWPMAREYLIWNTAVATLQFWTADLEAHVLSNAIEQVYNAFFYTTSTHLLHQQSEEVLFSHFMITLNAAFESKLTLEDEGYESGSENFNILTPLRCTSRILHISSHDNISFDPTTPCSPGTSQSHLKPVQCWLSFSTSDDEESFMVDIASTKSTTPPQSPMGFAQQPHSKCILTIHDDLGEDKEDEDIQTVSLDNDWTAEEIPDRHLCIPEHLLPHTLCSYPCPYMDYTSTSYHKTLDFSDISEFEDLMTTSSHEDIPALEDEIGY